MKKPLLLVTGIVLISLLHYFSPIHYHNLHALYQRLYYIPIILAAYWYGLKKGLLFTVLVGLCYAPHIFIQWSVHPTETFTQYIEIVMFFIISSLVGILSDVHRLQYRQIQDADRQIRRMDRLSLLGQLAAGLAHEIRNPLGSLVGSVEILKESLGEDHPKAEFVEIMRKELGRLSAKLTEFLKFARPSPPQQIENNLNDVAAAAIELVQKQADNLSCTITRNFDTTLPLIPMDAEQLTQVLLNLLLNAMQSMPLGGSIILTTWKEAAMTGISVTDEGGGIPDENREKIFDPFFTTKKEYSGLGLAIVKQLVEAMRGSIRVAVTAHGTCFEVRIPNEKP